MFLHPWILALLVFAGSGSEEASAPCGFLHKTHKHLRTCSSGRLPCSSVLFCSLLFCLLQTFQTHLHTCNISWFLRQPQFPLSFLFSINMLVNILQTRLFSHPCQHLTHTKLFYAKNLILNFADLPCLLRHQCRSSFTICFLRYFMFLCLSETHLVEWTLLP